MSTRRVRAFVDRFEGNKAVLLLGEKGVEVVTLPRSLLPPEAGEGTVLTVSIRVEPEKTAEASQRVSKLIRELTDAPDG